MTNRSMYQRRNEYLDVVRGLAIFLVVFGHCIQYGNGWGFDFFGDVVFKIIYSFHMPLFALVSGYLFFFSMSRRTSYEVVVRQITSLLVPALSWAIVWNLPYVHDIEIIAILNTFRHGFWFLWSMLLCSIGVFITEKFFAGRIFIYAAEIIVSVFVPAYIVSGIYIFMYPNFVAGYIWHREGLDERFAALPYVKKFYVGLLATALWLVMLCFFNHSSYVYITGTYVFSHRNFWYQIYIDMFRWLIGLVGSVSVMLMLKLVKSLQVLSFLGTKSLGIYIISGHVLRYLPAQGGYIINFVEAVVITFVCCIICMLIGKVKFLNKCLLGGR